MLDIKIEWGNKAGSNVEHEHHHFRFEDSWHNYAVFDDKEFLEFYQSDELSALMEKLHEKYSVKGKDNE